MREIKVLSIFPLLAAQSISDISCSSNDDCSPFNAVCPLTTWAIIAGVSGYCSCQTDSGYEAVTYAEAVTINGISLTTVCEIRK